MQKNRLFSMSAALLCALITVMLFMPSRAMAAGVDDNSLTIHFKAEDNAMAEVEFKLYYVATINKQALTVSPVAPFNGYNVLYGSAEWRVKASTLAGYVSRDKLEADASALTDANGRVRFTGLKDGMYLIVGQSKKAGSYTYTPVPSLIFLPNTSDYYNWQDDVTIEAKFTRRGGGSDSNTRNLRVLKVWDDDGFEDERPESITVDLLQDGQVIDTVVLNDDNNWRHDWSGLDRAAEYQVVEEDIGNYYASVEENGITFAITNTWSDTDIPDPDIPMTDIPDDPGDTPDIDIDIPDDDIPLADLPYTGQLWWPVPILAGCGMLLLAVGAALRRREA